MPCLWLSIRGWKNLIVKKKSSNMLSPTDIEWTSYILLIIYLALKTEQNLQCLQQKKENRKREWKDYGESRNNARPESDFVDLDDTNEGIERKKAEYTTSIYTTTTCWCPTTWAVEQLYCWRYTMTLYVFILSNRYYYYHISKYVSLLLFFFHIGQ